MTFDYKKIGDYENGPEEPSECLEQIAGMLHANGFTLQTISKPVRRLGFPGWRWGAYVNGVQYGMNIEGKGPRVLRKTLRHALYTLRYLDDLERDRIQDA